MDVKTVNFPLRGYFNLLKAQEPKTDDEKALMSKVPYVSVVGSLMYAMICPKSCSNNRSCRYMSNSGQEHWSAVKWT